MESPAPQTNNVTRAFIPEKTGNNPPVKQSFTTQYQAAIMGVNTEISKPVLNVEVISPNIANLAHKKKCNSRNISRGVVLYNDEASPALPDEASLVDYSLHQGSDLFQKLSGDWISPLIETNGVPVLCLQCGQPAKLSQRTLSDVTARMLGLQNREEPIYFCCQCEEFIALEGIMAMPQKLPASLSPPHGHNPRATIKPTSLPVNHAKMMIPTTLFPLSPPKLSRRTPKQSSRADNDACPNQEKLIPLRGNQGDATYVDCNQANLEVTMKPKPSPMKAHKKTMLERALATTISPRDISTAKQSLNTDNTKYQDFDSFPPEIKGMRRNIHQCSCHHRTATELAAGRLCLCCRCGSKACKLELKLDAMGKIPAGFGCHSTAEEAVTKILAYHENRGDPLPDNWDVLYDSDGNSVGSFKQTQSQ
ncbi:hypothetical protein SEMRO_3125_G344280.1 [Seminavis robusta]|uniref:Uncharacterized protein n=1 Tax=Seminavis robusta TaxID=568900 RepID=A0A9N8F3K0_9STRA|nr:hypothetical protein SEMRO_3125_G344280.1 [Seminavis robusta]|eukprot:Sro3125_g344280.1 n/a (421) ;mRNA; f:6622-7884